MKKVLSLFIVGFLLFGFSQKKEKQTDWEEDKLKGKVKSVTETQYRSVEKFGELQKGNLYEKYTFKYDYKGNKTEFADYNSDGSLKSKHIYKYDASGNVTEYAKHKSNFSLIHKYTSKYDDNGNEIEKAVYKSDGSLKWKETYKYDTMGNWTKMIRFEVKNEVFKTPKAITEREIEYYD